MAKPVFKIKLKKGDTVVIRSGKHSGKTGKVLQVHSDLNKVTVEGINIVKKHRKPTPSLPQGGIIELTKPIWISKVGLWDQTGKKASKIGYKISAKGEKSRVYKTSGREVKNG